MATYISKNSIHYVQPSEKNFYLFDNAILIINNTKEEIYVEAYHSSKVFIGPNVTVTGSVNMNSTMVNYSSQARISAYNESKIFNYSDAEIYAHDHSLITNRSNSIITSYACSLIYAFNNTILHAFWETNSHLYDNSCCFSYCKRANISDHRVNHKPVEITDVEQVLDHVLNIIRPHVLSDKIDKYFNIEKNKVFVKLPETSAVLIFPSAIDTKFLKERNFKYYNKKIRPLQTYDFTKYV